MRELRSVLEFGLSETAEVLKEAFADYVVRIPFSPSMLARLLVHDSIDPGASKVVLSDGVAIGASLIGRRGWTSRLAGMAIVPEARGQGIGGWLLSALIDAAAERGDRHVVLEVIEGNERAIRLYERSGFRRVRRLLGFDLSRPHPEPSNTELEEIDVREAARRVTRDGSPDLPWQISGETLALTGPPSRAFQLDGACATISDPSAPRIAIRSLLVAPDRRGERRAVALLRALFSRFPEKDWTVPPLCPEEFSKPLLSVGFQRGSLSQIQMDRRLA